MRVFDIQYPLPDCPKICCSWFRFTPVEHYIEQTIKVHRGFLLLRLNITLTQC